MRQACPVTEIAIVMLLALALVFRRADLDVYLVFIAR